MMTTLNMLATTVLRTLYQAARATRCRLPSASHLAQSRSRVLPTSSRDAAPRSRLRLPIKPRVRTRRPPVPPR